jgi:predicted nucleic acid-binding protein
MSISALECVVDASVVIKLFVVEPLSEQADLLFDQLVHDPPAHFYVPDLLFIECAKILWKHVRRFGYAAEQAQADVADLRALALHSVSTADLIGDTLPITLTHAISAYDACYVALAQRLSVPFITADEALVRKLAGTSYAVQWLGRFIDRSS